MSGNVNFNAGANKAGQVRKFNLKQLQKSAIEGMNYGIIKGLSIFDQANKADTTRYQGKANGFGYSGTVDYSSTIQDFENGKPVGEHEITGEVEYHADVNVSDDANYEK